MPKTNLSTLTIGIGAPLTAFGQGNELIIEKMTSASLTGVVHYDESTDKDHALEGVSISTCDHLFSSCSAVAVTDNAGKFSIPMNGKRKIYYLKFLLLGWDLEQVTVAIKHGADPLDIRLHIGT